MQALKETTKDWNFPNHTYRVSGSKCIAYIKEGTTKPIKISGKKGDGMIFDRRGRTFQKVSIKLFED